MSCNDCESLKYDVDYPGYFCSIDCRGPLVPDYDYPNCPKSKIPECVQKER